MARNITRGTDASLNSILLEYFCLMPAALVGQSVLAFLFGGREQGGEGRKAWLNHPGYTCRSEARGFYFTDDKGQRTALLFLDMRDASQIPAIVEPWMLAFNASIEVHPVMVPDDLAKAASAIETAVNKYG
jgi:hypothetical protein